MSKLDEPIPLDEASETIADSLQAWGSYTGPHSIPLATVTSANTIIIRMCREHPTQLGVMGRGQRFRIIVEAMEDQ
jgi:hypothetical protein